MSYKTRLFWILWAAGFAGVLSFLLVDLSALIASLPQPPGEPVELPPPALLKLVSIIQPAVIMTLAVLAGVFLAERVGLHSPAAEAAARGEKFFPGLKPQILPGVLAGLASGVAIVLTWVIARPFFTAEFIARAEAFNTFIPAAVRLLYGGFTEELLLRWGVMTFLVWAAWRLLGTRAKSSPPYKGGVDAASADGVVLPEKQTPKSVYFIGAIVLSAVIFGMGHLPIASALAGGLTLPLVIYVITGNSIFGIVAGFLYWKKGLEAAIIAHMSAHLVLILAIYLAF
jgi:hypothetical protein